MLQKPQHGIHQTQYAIVITVTLTTQESTKHKKKDKKRKSLLQTQMTAISFAPRPSL